MIYKGTWDDGDGNPLDPAAAVIQTTAAGGSVRIRRFATGPHPAHPPFVATIRYARDRWLNVLSQANRDWWDTLGVTGASRRGDLAREPVSGWTQYNAFVFAQLYFDPPSYVLPPGVYAENFTTASADSVDVPNQTVTFTVDMDALLPFRDEVRLLTYQIDPAAVRYTNPWRATRMIDLTKPPVVPPPPYVQTSALAWPVAAGDLVRLYWRGRVGNWWKYHADDTVTA